MWLIDVNSFKLKYFVGDQVPEYAILSHTWGEEEVSFGDIQDDLEAAQSKTGFWKIKQTCLEAKKEGLLWAWVDTCCIDKSSSAELQEAINSMFMWYYNARNCYAYLDDVQGGDYASLASCRWFTRGWTLQELLAPSAVVFFDRNWNGIGTRIRLADKISVITGIDGHLLREHWQDSGRAIINGVMTVRQPDRTDRIRRYSIAQRMSWAANRNTTRIEDRAYSLLGLFGVNIPLLYGEGHATFMRLQEELLTRNSDLSILAWERTGGRDLDTWNYLLASSPDEFADSKDIIRQSAQGAGFAPHQLFSDGLRVTLPVVEVPDKGQYLRWAALLGCRSQNDVTHAIALRITTLPSLLEDSSTRAASNNMNRHLPLCRVDAANRLDMRLVYLDVLYAAEASRLTTFAISRAGYNSNNEFANFPNSDSVHVWIRFATFEIGADWKTMRATSSKPQEVSCRNRAFDIPYACLDVVGQMTLQDTIGITVVICFTRRLVKDSPRSSMRIEFEYHIKEVQSNREEPSFDLCSKWLSSPSHAVEFNDGRAMTLAVEEKCIDSCDIRVISVDVAERRRHSRKPLVKTWLKK